MRVITLNERNLASACRRLELSVRFDYEPDLIVSISPEGEFLASNLFGDVPHVSVMQNHPTEEVKENANLLFRILRRSPRQLADMLRIMEVHLIRVKTRIERTRVAHISESVVNALAGAKRVLMVDTTVDTGVTLQAVTEALKQVPGEREMRSAVMTMTTRAPLLQADYSLYHNGTIIRFPWSKDFYTL